MIKNTIVSLSSSSKERIDALNSIKYTLLLNYETPQIVDFENAIPQIMNNCYKCCRGLFLSDESAEKSKINFYFFGAPSIDSDENEHSASKSAKQKNLEQESDELSFLDAFPPTAPACSTINKAGFPTMILDHCVLSCYHAVITDLLQDRTVTSYECINSLKSAGIFSLYKNNRLDFSSQDILKKTQNSVYKNPHNSSKASDFMRTVKTHLKSEGFKALGSLFIKDFFAENEKKADAYFLQFAPLLTQICKIDARELRFFSSSIKEQNKFIILENYEIFSEKFFWKFGRSIQNIHENSFSKTFGSPVDELYYRYIAERVFGCNLFYCLLRNIHRIEKNTDFRLCQSHILNVLTTCQSLPNVFSRQYFIQYAFDKIITTPISYLDFWHEHVLDMTNTVLETSSKFNTHFQFTKWLDQFSLFCKYMSEYVIPIYEWCFTNMVMETAEEKIISEKSTHSLSPDRIHTRRLLQAMDMLGKYMEKNYKRILCPIYISNFQDSLDIITKHKQGIHDLNMSADALKTLLDSFSPAKRNLDLNLTSSLNPAFFLNGGNGNTNNNMRHIRNFYINLLYPV